MKYRKLLALMVVVFAIALSVPGCGKGSSPANTGGAAPGLFGTNGFQALGGSGQATLLSLNNCYPVYKTSAGTVSFPIATNPQNPFYVQNGALYASAYVAQQLYNAGNSYIAQTSYGDSLSVYLYNDQYFSGIVNLSSTTVKSIQLYLSQQGVYRGADPTTLCVDGMVFYQTMIQGQRLQGGMTLYVNDTPVINF